MMLNTYLQSILPWTLPVQNEYSMSFYESIGSGNILNFIQIDCNISEKCGH